MIKILKIQKNTNSKLQKPQKKLLVYNLKIGQKKLLPIGNIILIVRYFRNSKVGFSNKPQSHCTLLSKT